MNKNGYIEDQLHNVWAEYIVKNVGLSIYSLHPYRLLLLVLEGSLHSTKRERQMSTQLQNSEYNDEPFARSVSAIIVWA